MATNTTGIAAGNADMAAVWDGPEGDHWAEHADHYEATGPAFDQALLGAIEVDSGGRVLDVGCGTGSLTLAAARRVPSGTALGVDLSARMLERGRAKAAAAGLENVTFRQADAQVHPFEAGAFDVAFSSFGVMFFADPVAAFANIRRALRPDGALAVLAWRDLERNEWLSSFRDALAAGRDLPTPPAGVPGPFGMADRSITHERLSAAGFADVAFTTIDEPVWFGRDLDDAWSFVSNLGMARGLTHDLDDAARADAFRELRDSLAAHETADGVGYGASAWLITARNPAR
jgi:SAM-dependent methyltransferase